MLQKLSNLVLSVAFVCIYSIFMHLATIFLFVYVVLWNDILSVVVDRAALTSIKFDSMNNFSDSVHRYYRLNILLLEKTLLSKLELFIFLELSFKSITAALAALSEAAAESEDQRNEPVCAVWELEFFSLD